MRLVWSLCVLVFGAAVSSAVADTVVGAQNQSSAQANTGSQIGQQQNGGGIVVGASTSTSNNTRQADQHAPQQIGNNGNLIGNSTQNSSQGDLGIQSVSQKGGSASGTQIGAEGQFANNTNTTNQNQAAGDGQSLPDVLIIGNPVQGSNQYAGQSQGLIQTDPGVRIGGLVQGGSPGTPGTPGTPLSCTANNPLLIGPALACVNLGGGLIFASFPLIGGGAFALPPSSPGTYPGPLGTTITLALPTPPTPPTPPTAATNSAPVNQTQRQTIGAGATTTLVGNYAQGNAQTSNIPQYAGQTDTSSTVVGNTTQLQANTSADSKTYTGFVF